jgi:hypothetical protein
MISDKFVKRVLSPTLLLIFIFLISPCLISSIVIYSTDFLHDVEPGYIIQILDRYNNFKGLPSDILAIIIQTLPAFIGAICYRRSSDNRLNIYGKLAFLILLIGALFSTANIIYLSPEDKNQIGALTLGKEGIKLIEKGCESTLRNCLTYILLFTGLQVSVEK